LSGSKEKFSKNYSRPSMDAVDYAIVIAQSDDVELTALYVASSPNKEWVYIRYARNSKRHRILLKRNLNLI